jgi:predicted transcriptional regulator
VTSLEYIKLLKGKPAGVYPRLDKGKLNKTIKASADRLLSKIDQRIAKMEERAGARRKDTDEDD